MTHHRLHCQCRRALSRPREPQSVAFQPMARQLRPYTRAQVGEAVRHGMP